jgi:siderophore synthetase component
VLELPGGPAVPLRADGFLADLAVAPSSALASALTLGDVERALGAAPAADADGVAAFGVECRQALAALRLRARHLPAALPPGPWLGTGGSVCYDAVAAARPHPAYPTAACRLGFTDEDSLRYAPEFWPEFELNWVAVPRAAMVTARPGRPGWWPTMRETGLPEVLADTHELMPVHPLTARLALPRALAEAGLAEAGLAEAGLAEAGLAGVGRVTPGRWLRVRPTLSTRTVVVTADPQAQLKLPLPVSTLGLRNRRAMEPRTLGDGALVRRVLAAAADRDPGLDTLLLADDADFGHAGHPCLAYLRRRLPDGLGADRIVPVAALLAETNGRPVIEELAGPEPVPAYFRRYLDLVFGIAVRLFVRYGIALESHQQDAALVAGPGLRLLIKDFDGALINHARLAAALGGAAPEPGGFGDQRMLTASDDALADVFITITVHLCAGAIAFGLADRGFAPLAGLLAMVREALEAALDRQAGDPAARLLRARALEAGRLPVKAMLTAGTLTDKARTGARDINKFYARRARTT